MAHSQSGEELAQTNDYKEPDTQPVDTTNFISLVENYLFQPTQTVVSEVIQNVFEGTIVSRLPQVLVHGREFLINFMRKTNLHPLPKSMTTRSQTVSPLPGNSVVSSTCDHKGGIICSAEDAIKVIIPVGSIKEGDSVTISIATSLFGRFILPSQYQANLASPFYWIGVSESYRFQKPIRVEFEHFAVVTACDPSHYQLLTCEDDDISHIMRPVDYELRFDNESRCTFYTDHFCSYCLYHKCEDPMISRIGMFLLKPKNFQTLDQFTVEIWFSFPISHCLKRNEELYTSKGMVLDSSIIFTASCDKNSKSYFALTYDKHIEGWRVDHLRSTEVQTKMINFYYLYASVDDLFAHEKRALFPPRFIINVIKQPGCTADLNVNINMSLCEAEGRKSIGSAMFKLSVPVSANTSSLASIDHYCCDKSKPKLGELVKFSSKISMHWEVIAVTLGLPTNEIDRIKHYHHTNAERICGMFTVWLRTQRSPCWCHFISALYKVDLNEVAERAKLYLEESCGTVVPSDMTRDNFKSKYSEHVLNSHEFVRFLKDIPDQDLNFFIICLVSKDSAIQVIKQIRHSNGSKEDNLNNICEAFLKERDPSWSKVHKALKEVDCDDLAELVEACFLPV